MDSVVYNIPLSMVRTYRGRNTIVRAAESSELVEKLSNEDLERLSYIQILAPDREIDGLNRWEPPVPVDLLIRYPHRDLPLLYEYSPLLARRPVRVSISAAPGFGKAVKLAASLKLAVKLEMTQPEPGLVDELLQIVDYYLHHSSVVQPIEFFHSLFLAFYRREQVKLWAIQEEDPSLFRYVTDQGEEVISGRLPEVKLGAEPASFLTRLTQELMTERTECRECDFFNCCGGYFKLPQKEFSCNGVKILFQTLREASEELAKDFAESRVNKGESR